MPNGRAPKSNDDKDWKVAVDRSIEEMRREIAALRTQVNRSGS